MLHRRFRRGHREGQLPLRELKGGHGIPPESGGRDTRRRNRRHGLRGHRPLRGKPEILPRTGRSPLRRTQSRPNPQLRQKHQGERAEDRQVGREVDRVLLARDEAGGLAATRLCQKKG